jgi:hypothetical protein
MQNKNKFKAEIDFCFTDGEELQFLSVALDKYKLQISKIIPNGLAGGNPAITFIGDYENLHDYLQKEYYQDEPDAEELYGFSEWIKECQQPEFY